jgi:hypothetical protein
VVLGRCLFITASCCRRARFSKVNSLRRAGRTRRLMTENKSLNMHLNIRCSSAESQFLQADVILTNHNHHEPHDGKLLTLPLDSNVLTYPA